MITIQPEEATDRGLPLFNLPGINIETFADAGLRMSQSRTFPPLHCRLTITDTIESSASADFELGEA
jgi:hypothetical protein